jgi:two-component system CheB/CheR fusion protein
MLGKPSRRSPSSRAALNARKNPKSPAQRPPSEATPEPALVTGLGPVVGMGASAGGLEAFQKFFTHMPPDSGMAFIVVQHLDPRHTTLLPELLGKTTRMSVEQVRDETPVQNDHVYVIPPNSVLTIEGGVLRLSAPPERSGPRMPIDSLFHSLAEDQRHRAVCLLLSGSGTDGTLGLRSVKEHGGMAMAQSPESARHDSILRSAIATGLVDHVLPPEEMPTRLVEYAAYLRDLQDRNAAGDLFEEAGGQLKSITTLLQRKTGHDFSRYKTTTLLRRIQRRMQVQQVASVLEYVDRLRQDPKETGQLFRDLLISVTHFFRDPEAFNTLARLVIPNLVRETQGVLRVWTPGCATGEEAYSIAILLREEMAKSEERPKVQIFAGDIDEDALEFARHAVYPEGIAEHVTPERLERFFVKKDHSYQVAKDMREMCIFSAHNLIKDPPFSRLDLIVCRNLMIYLEGDLQRQVATLFHYALRPGGYLFLGPSESVVGPPDMFRTIDKKHRIFQRSEAVALHVSLPVPEPAPRRPGGGPAPWAVRVPAAEQHELLGNLERLLVDEYAPAWVIVNSEGETVVFSKRTGRYLEPAPGAPSANLLAMARQGLRLDLRTALHKAAKSGETVTHENVSVETNGDVQSINLVVRPVPELGKHPSFFLVVFQELGPARPREAAAPTARAGGDGHIVEQLESELRTTREHLQATIEEVETSNEELKSSNEEMLSTNEELQSANEELQTSKEELQSVNEELETINAELNKKLEQLDIVNSDLQNLLQSTQIPTLFLDNSLRIKRFTHAATEVFHLLESDLGRPITDMAPRFDGDLVTDLREVQRSLVGRERNVRLADGSASYLVRILPYRRVDNLVDGLVITFLDLTQLHHAQAQRARLAAIVDSSQDAIVGRTLDGTITTWNQAASEMFDVSTQEAIGNKFAAILPPEGVEEIEHAQQLMEQGGSVAPYESVRRARDGRQLDVSVAMSPIRDAVGKLVGSSAIFRDITELKRVQDQLRRETHEKDQFLALLSHELRNPLSPLRTSLELLRSNFDVTKNKLVERSLHIMDRQLTQLTSLVDQLLDAARISSGKIVLDPVELDLNQLVREVLEDHRRLFEDARLTLNTRLPERPIYVRGDRLRLAQALGNLIANAVKFTEPDGRVTVKAESIPSRHQAVVTITDDGIGMDSRTQARLFQPFAQSTAAGERSRGGLGLGLWLVKGLVDAHGGIVSAFSAGRGEGSQVTLRLPLLAAPELARRPPKESRESPEAPVVGRRILIVEDNVDAAESLRRLLELKGHTVEVAATGAEGLEIAPRFRPEVVLCDIQLRGDLDGYAVATAIRSGGDGSPPYLVALTGYGQPEDRERTRAAGFDWHLTKPPHPDELARLIAELPRPVKS